MLNKEFLLVGTGSGLTTISEPFRTDKDSLVLNVKFTPKAENLGAVVVQSRRNLVRQEDDKTIVDAEPLANSSSDALEILEKTPGTVVDQDGNVYIASTTPATIYINGREMKLSSSEIASLLKSLPAEAVSKIEILRTPSSKYDASGSGGIINIVLKKGVKLGTNGSVYAGWYQGAYSTEMTGFSLTRNRGKLSSTIGYDFKNRKTFEEINSSRFISTDSTALVQSSFSTYSSNTHFARANLNYAFNDNWTLNFDHENEFVDGLSRSHNTNQISKNNPGTALSNSLASGKNNYNNSYTSESLSSKLKLDSIGSEWTISLDYTYYRNNNNQDYNNALSYPFSKTLLGNGIDQTTQNTWVPQTDLTWKKFKGLTVEAGFKATLGSNATHADYFQDTGTGNIFNPYQSNNYKYKENIIAGYLQGAITKWGFTFKPGLRLEHTDMQGRLLFPGDTSFRLKRTDLFPYVYIRHKLFSIFTYPLVGSAIFRKSIRRPSYESLNPYPEYVDPYLFNKGNPQLRPQFTTTYEVNATYNDIPVFAVGINDTKDIFTQVTYQDEQTKIAYRTYDNLGKNREYYFKLVGGMPPGKKYFMYAGAQYNYNIYNGFYQGQPLNYKRGSWLFFMYQQWKILPSLSVDMQGFLRSKALQNFYELKTFGGMFVSVNKTFLKKKLNLNLALSDVLRTNHTDFTLRQGDIFARGTRYTDTHRFRINLRYNFGLKAKEEKKQSYNIPGEG